MMNSTKRSVKEVVSMLMPEKVKRILKPIYHRMRGVQPRIELDQKWIIIQKKLSESKNIIDLGCGDNPVKGARVGVDLYIEPKERLFGFGPKIDVEKMKEKGTIFVNSRIDAVLPFEDKEFDFAYSNHVFEHVENPAVACGEMMRIARSGAIITPSIFAELMFGRSYHRWLVIERGGAIFFFKKRPLENKPFGEHPKHSSGTGWIVEESTNPFDILLNDGEWYRGRQKMPRLSKLLRKLWYSHSPVTETIFLWDGEFDCFVYE